MNSTKRYPKDDTKLITFAESNQQFNYQEKTRMSLRFLLIIKAKIFQSELYSYN